ncbi:MAG: dTDP-glucose 4,6-dehydratase [Firmicutes bacterium]|nr:dTDP-glucose 4,6-dehydratase [Bacillota bacterium]
MKLLVTGGMGFIGANFIRYVRSKQPAWAVVNVDKLTYAGNPENLADLEEGGNYRFFRGDIADYSFMEPIFQRGVDVVVNFAAESHVDRSIQDADPFVKSNIVGAQVLLELARRHAIKKFIQVSTDEVYGSLGAEGKFGEDAPLCPNSPYSASKAAADLLCRSFFKTYGVPVIVTRGANNFGPYQFPEKFMALIITNAVEEQAIPVYGDGLNVRDWIYVEDHCRALEAVLLKGQAGEIYNIGADNELSNLDLVRQILNELNKPDAVIKFVQDRPGHDRRYAVQSAKIKQLLRWRPVYSFREALKLTVNWYLAHPDWWKRVKSGSYRQYYQEWYGGLAK